MLDPPTVNEALDLENIEFEVNSAVITAAGQADLQKAVEFFSSYELSASIEGHTDTDGSTPANQDLSEQRAAAVKDFLVAAGLMPIDLPQPDSVKPNRSPMRMVMRTRLQADESKSSSAKSDQSRFNWLVPRESIRGIRPVPDRSPDRLGDVDRGSDQGRSNRVGHR